MEIVQAGDETWCVLSDASYPQRQPGPLGKSLFVFFIHRRGGGLRPEPSI